MNLLIVDDQLSVISGLRNNIHFKDLGFDEVLSATSADEAMKILSDRPVEVMLTDIEMPEKNGLQLNEEVQKQYPDILRIVLTSHAVFSYAKESVRLGCFDYIVQPAPITEIEEALRKAVDHVNLIYNNRRMNEYGELFNSHRSEFLQNSILKLYSENDQEFSEGIDMLNSSGFHIHPETITQMILLDVFSYSQSLPVHPQQREVMASLDKALKLLIEGRMDAEYLVSMTADRKFLILIFSNDAETMDISDRFLLALHNSIKLDTHDEGIAVYVTLPFPFREMREVNKVVRYYVQYNVAHTPDIFLVRETQPIRNFNQELPDYINRWNMMLGSGQISLLKKDIQNCIDKIRVSDHQYMNLCDLHQQLTQLFFRHFYEKGVNIMALFTDDYSYQDCMGSFSSIEEFERAVQFLLSATDTEKSVSRDSDYVEKAKTYIAENNSQILTVRDVSDYVHLNPEYFTRLFKKETGLNIKNYIIDCKIASAKDMLLHTSLPVSMIALELGYSNFSHFTQMFRKAEGITPSEYRMKAE
ncbi:MAG: helix-turn-helix domain-containing protein [Lachnospiraceae bacterium]|nr:helix-turn-helix domain-containing protein [Lachnospiraceae bacterium]